MPLILYQRNLLTRFDVKRLAYRVGYIDLEVIGYRNGFHIIISVQSLMNWHAIIPDGISASILPSLRVVKPILSEIGGGHAGPGPGRLYLCGRRRLCIRGYESWGPGRSW